MLHYQAMAKKAMSKKATPKKAKSKARIRHLSDGIEVTIMPKKAMSKMAKKAMSKKAISKAGRPPGTTKQPWWKKQGRPSTGVSGLLLQLASSSPNRATNVQILLNKPGSEASQKARKLYAATKAIEGLFSKVAGFTAEEIWRKCSEEADKYLSDKDKFGSLKQKHHTWSQHSSFRTFVIRTGGGAAKYRSMGPVAKINGEELTILSLFQKLRPRHTDTSGVNASTAAGLAHESDDILAEEIEALEDLRNEIDERMLALKDRRDKYWLDRRRPLG